MAELDARGLSCPLPVLRTNKILKTLPAGSLLRVLATDAGALADIPAFCRQTGHVLVDQSSQDGLFTFVIRRSKI